MTYHDACGNDNIQQVGARFFLAFKFPPGHRLFGLRLSQSTMVVFSGFYNIEFKIGRNVGWCPASLLPELSRVQPKGNLHHILDYAFIKPLQYKCFMWSKIILAEQSFLSEFQKLSAMVSPLSQVTFSITFWADFAKIILKSQ